ncbi:MAG TPA: ABC transporter ATP-binding protein [Actinomycetes bacterium]|nr:ABC transporter ATP-binding protein [Actinomycetes bacterium]
MSRRDGGSGRRARAWLWPLVRPHRGLVALGSLAVLTQTAAGLAMPWLVGVAIDRGVVPRRLQVLDRIALVYLGLAGVQFLAGRVEALAVAGAGQRVLYAVRTRLFSHLQTLSLDFYERERTGRLVARMTSDIEAMSDLVTDGLVTLVTSLVTLAGIAVILVLLDWQLALATLAVAPLIALAATRYRRWSSEAYRQVRETHSVVTVRYQEALSGVRAIQSFRRERATSDGLAQANHAERAAHRRTIALASFFFPGIEFLGAAATAVVLGVGGAQVLHGGLEIGVLASFLLYLRNLFDPVQQLSELYDTFQSATAGAERVGAVLAVTPTVAEAADPVPLPHPRGELRLEGVRFAYADPAGDGDGAPEVLHGIDLRVPAGATLALVGPTGAGKSTVAKLISRFYDPVAGRVTIDGVDLRQVRLADLRRAMGYVPQEGFLFSGFDSTVAGNIRFGRPDASRAEVEQAARAVGADRVIGDLPDGYDTQVGERGAMLSAGERQLVGFARAWIADPAVLILDEATSALDVVTEARVTEAVRRLRQGRTTIVIAHRLSTVIEADLVAVVEDGRVVEAGPPSELVAADGRFAALYDRWLAGAA